MRSNTFTLISQYFVRLNVFNYLIKVAFCGFMYLKLEVGFVLISKMYTIARAKVLLLV